MVPYKFPQVLRFGKMNHHKQIAKNVDNKDQVL
jgi:hypothetical protein